MDNLDGETGEAAERETGEVERVDRKSAVAMAMDRLRASAGGSADEIEQALMEATGQTPQWGIGPRLHAYRSVIEMERTGRTGGHSTTQAQAFLEVRELMEGAQRFDIARVLATAYSARFPRDEDLARAQTLLSGPGDNRLRWRDNPNLDVQIVAKAGAKTTVIVFCGFRHTFGLPLNLLYNVWLANYDVNAVFVRDWKRVVYLAGIASLGNADQSVAKLRGIARDLGSERIVTTGNSGGGLGALWYGGLLGADRILGFAPAVDFDVALSYVSRKLKNRLTALHKSLGANFPHLPKLLRDAPDVRADVFFSAGNDIDRRHAKTLAGIPNVNLLPLQNVDTHGVLTALARRGQLEPTFREAFESAPMAARARRRRERV